MHQIFDFSRIEPILKDPEAAQVFKKLLDAVITDDFSKIGALQAELLYDFVTIKAKVEKLIYNKFYESIYDNEAYISLLNFMIDLYSIFLTMVNLRKNLVHIRMQPDEIVDAYLDTFGFPSKHLFNYIHRREIAEHVYGYLRKKGTPESLMMIMKFLGYQDFYLCEYWVTDKENPKFVAEFLTEKPEFLYGESVIPYLDVDKNKDPLWLQTSADIKKLLHKKKCTMPVSSPYYGVGMIVNDARTFRIFCAVNAVLVRKLLSMEFSGGNITTISSLHYHGGKLSYIDLLLGWAYVMDRLFNAGWILSTVFDSLHNRLSWAYSWNLNTHDKPISEIYNEIVQKVDELFSPVKIKDPVKDQKTFLNHKTPLEIKNERFEEIKNTFYGTSEFDPYIQKREDFISYFSNRNNSYLEFLKDQIDSHPIQIKGSMDYLSSLLEEIANEIEMYLFTQANVKINIKSLTLTYYRFFKSMKEVDRSFTPYHSTFLELHLLFAIQDFPGDQIVFDDSHIKTTGEHFVIDHLNHPYDDDYKDRFSDTRIFSDDFNQKEQMWIDQGIINLVDAVAYNIKFISDLKEGFTHDRHVYVYDPPYDHEVANFYDESNHTRYDIVGVVKDSSPRDALGNKRWRLNRLKKMFPDGNDIVDTYDHFDENIEVIEEKLKP